MDTQKWFRLLRDGWIFLVVGLVVGAAAGWGVARLAPAEYTAHADVFVTVTGSSTTGDLAQGINFSQQQARNFSAVATRGIVLEPVIEALDLDMTVSQLRHRVAASVELNTSVISISASDGDPDLAAAIANRVANTLAGVVPTLSPEVDGKSPVSLRVVESAVPPRYPSAPSVPLFTVAGALIGVVLGAGVTFVRLLRGTVIKTRDQLAEETGHQVIGAIAWDRATAEHPLSFVADPDSLRAEEFRQLRANLRFLQAGVDTPTFVVTSSLPGEGKSTIAANAALALAASGLSVVLVEADLRRPTLSEIFDLPPGIGLTSLITGEVTLDEATFSWPEPEMAVILAGPIPPNPSELLESSAAQRVLSEIRDAYDVVIIDAPPLIPVADAAVIARTVGGVILVSSARSTRAREIHRAIAKLEAVGARVDGVVLNMAPLSSGARHTYASYSNPRDAAVTERTPNDDERTASAATMSENE